MEVLCYLACPARPLGWCAHCGVWARTERCGLERAGECLHRPPLSCSRTASSFLPHIAQHQAATFLLSHRRAWPSKPIYYIYPLGPWSIKATYRMQCVSTIFCSDASSCYRSTAAESATLLLPAPVPGDRGSGASSQG